MRGRFWRSFLTGLLVLLPALVTVAVLQLLFGWVFRVFINPVAKAVALVLPVQLQSPALVRLLILIAFVLVVTLIGFGTRVILVRRFMRVGESLIRRVPIVGKIYGTSREIADSFSGQRKGLFGRVVLLEWPRQGLYAIGFVTSEVQGEVQEKTPQHVVNVFIPTTPNPTSGYLVLAPRESLIDLEMSVEDGMRLVISGGVTGPNVRVPNSKG